MVFFNVGCPYFGRAIVCCCPARVRLKAVGQEQLPHHIFGIGRYLKVRLVDYHSS